MPYKIINCLEVSDILPNSRQDKLFWILEMEIARPDTSPIFSWIVIFHSVRDVSSCHLVIKPALYRLVRCTGWIADVFV